MGFFLKTINYYTYSSIITRNPQFLHETPQLLHETPQLLHETPQLLHETPLGVFWKVDS